MSWDMKKYTYEKDGENHFIKSGKLTEISATCQPAYPSTIVKVKQPNEFSYKARKRELELLK